MRQTAITAARTFACVVALLCATTVANARGQVSCPDGVDPTASRPLTQATSTSNCATKTINGFPVPDSSCTPGAVNPTVTLEVLQGGEFKTGCERDKASSAQKKAGTYDAYNIDHPDNNTGKNQTCELDHLISLEIGGADTIDNIWPQCGPSDAELADRYFKIKDSVENYLAAEVKAGDIPLNEAQNGIAHDWTQYIDKAKAYWSTHQMRGFGKDN
jgi:hypothetical protein